MTTGLERPGPLYRQICSQLEGQILSGRLNAGDRLPTTQDLAVRFGVTVQTAQQAATLLSQRGLIERIPGRGSFVSNRVTSRTIGVVFGSNVFGHSHTLFYQRVYGFICKELKALGWHVGLYFPMEDDAPEQMLAELSQDLDGGRLRGVVALCSSQRLNGWLAEHAGVPHAETAAWDVLPPVHQRDAYRGVEYLLARGYRRVAVVAHTESMDAARVATIREGVEQACVDHGGPGAATLHTGPAATLADGAARAREVLADQPDALLVLNDMGCTGAIFELLCRQLRIPQDIAVMGATNKGIEVPCPVPLTRLELDVAAFAHRTIEDILARIAGRSPAPQPSISKLVVGQSCGETNPREMEQ